jgi:transposase
VPERRLPMRQVREILRLHFEAKLKDRQIAKICSVGKGTVRRYLKRLAAAHLSWPLPGDLDETTLEQRMFPPPPMAPEGRPLPDFNAVHKELKGRKNVTLQLLWEEYREAYPDGFNYSWYCELYRHWARKLDIVLRQEHRAGEKTFVDHAGQTMPVTDPGTGEIREAYVFVAVLGASSYAYAEATWTRGLWDWIGSHTRALEFFGGASRLVVPDNWRSGVKTPCYYEPELNRTYAEWAIHYGVGILPARPRRARDKAYVSYCTLFSLANGEHWLGCSTAAMPFDNCGMLERLIQGVITVVANNASEKAAPRPFVHRRLRDPQRHAHFLGRQETSFAQAGEPALKIVGNANTFNLLPGEGQILPRPISLLV